MIPRIAFTPGEPAGIGIDLAIMLSQQPLKCELVYFSNKKLLEQRAKTLGITIIIDQFATNSKPSYNKAKQIKLIDFDMAKPNKDNQLEPLNSAFVLNTIKQAALSCINNTFQAMVTGPIHKGIINDSGIKFSGHTEFLQEIAQVKQVVMMLANKKFRVALATTHLPLKNVADAITQESLITTLTIINKDLTTRFGINKPHILVAGLNPHAGEQGYLGNEEITTITPALEYCRNSLDINITGPLPADTLFNVKYLNNADAVLAMYHDQGLPVLKYSGFGQSINITLGLPFIRTSVDHGTACDIIGTGKADVSSLKLAVANAIKMSTI